jgi:hypothetical protein
MLLAPSKPPSALSSSSLHVATIDAAAKLASVRVILGHSEGTIDVASVVTVLIVPNFQAFDEPAPKAEEWRPFPLMPVSSKLEYVLISVRLLPDAIDWFVVVIVESATDTRIDSLPICGDSPAPEALSERSDGRERIGERGGRIGGTSSRSLVPVGVSCPPISAPPPMAEVPVSLEDEETESGLVDRNVGRPTPTAEGGGGDGDVHCCLVLFRVVSGEDGDFDGDGEYECRDADKFGEDMAAREEEAEEKEVPGRYGEPRGGGAFTATDVLMGLRTPSRELRECVRRGVSAHLTSAIIVFATRASESEEASTRSSCRKRSSGERPLAEQDARNLVTLDMRSLPSSRASIRPMEPGRNLFINLMRVC